MGCVVLETSLGDLVVDLYTDECPKTTLNFLKLCKIKYYNNVLFHNIQPDFIVQTGDPEGTGRGGESIYGQLYGSQARYFNHEIRDNLRHKKKGIVAMASRGKDTNASQFYIQISDRHLEDLDGDHTIFGEISEGLDVLQKIGDQYCNDAGRPLRNIRIRHTVIIEDPFDDPKNLRVPSRSPSPRPDKHDIEYLRDDEEFGEDERPEDEIQAEEKASKADRATDILEAIGDLPHKDIKPPDNVLFVCKLNAVTTDEDLETIFSQFGTIIKCEVIRDWKTGESLNYAFIEYETEEMCKRAYLKMDNIQIDDRRIHVDFSQSVSKLWNRWNKGDRSILYEHSKDYKSQQTDKPVPRRKRKPGLEDEEQSEKINYRVTGTLDPDAKPPGTRPSRGSERDKERKHKKKHRRRSRSKSPKKDRDRDRKHKRSRPSHPSDSRPKKSRKRDRSSSPRHRKRSEKHKHRGEKRHSGDVHRRGR